MIVRRIAALVGVASVLLCMSACSKQPSLISCDGAPGFAATVAEARNVLPGGAAAELGAAVCWEGGFSFGLFGRSQADANLSMPAYIARAERDGWTATSFPECRSKVVDGAPRFMYLIGHDKGDPMFGLGVATSEGQACLGETIPGQSPPPGQ